MCTTPSLILVNNHLWREIMVEKPNNELNSILKPF